MPRLTLRFVGVSSYSLEECTFISENPCVNQTSRRGSGLLTSSASFPWTAGVKALAVALLKYRMKYHQDNGEPWVLSGGAGSLARSLDYSFSKQPQWLIEMFGIDKSGNALARRLLLRDNPEGKRPGPTRFAVNSRMITPTDVEVFLSGRELDSLEDLQSLLKTLERDSVRNRAPRQSAEPQERAYREKAASALQSQSYATPGAAWCAAIATQEAKRVLANTRSFSNQLVLKHLALAHRRMAYRENRAIALFELSLPSTARAQPNPDWKFLQLRLEHYGGLRVGISTGGVASIAICDRLAMRGLPIGVEYTYANSQETVTRIRDGTLAGCVDAVNLSVACALRLMSERRRISFVPFMVMPHNSHAIVGQRDTASQRRERRVPLLYSDCSSASLYEAKPNSRQQSKASRICDGPIELLDVLLENEDAYSPVWWPHYEVLGRSPLLAAFDLPPRWEYDLTVLFVHERFCRDREFGNHLALAVRDAWLDLVESPSMIESLVAGRYREEHFVKFFMRSCGMQHESLNAASQTDIFKVASRTGALKEFNLVVNRQ